METTEFEALQVGDRVRIIKSGKIYQMIYKIADGRTGFKQWREDRQALFGAITHPKIENVEAVSR